MRRLILMVLAVAVISLTTTGLAQQQQILAKPDEQAQVKPLIDELKKADQARVAKLATLPEAQAVRDAEAALNKAREALDKAAGNLPETAAWKDVYTRLRITSYRLQAKHGLSSLEYEPRITEKGELAFVPAKTSTSP